MATPTETLPAVKVSLKIKTFALLSLVMLAIGTALCWFFLYHTKETLETARQQYAMTLGKQLAYYSQQGVLTEDIKLLQSVMDGIWQEESVLGVLIANTQGNFIVQRYKALAGAQPLSLTWQQTLERAVSQVLPVATPLVHVHIVDGSEVYHVAVPTQTIATGVSQPAPKGVAAATLPGAQGTTQRTPARTTDRPGSVHLFFSPEHIPMDLHRAWVASVALPLGLLLFGLLASWLCLHYTLAPMQAITRAARRIAAGDLSQRIVASSHDEIGVLASILNRMTTSLAQMTGGQAQRGGTLAALHSIGAVLNATLGRDQPFAPVLEAIVRHFGYDHVRLFLVDTDRQVLVSASAAGTVPALAALQDGCIPLRDGCELHERVALHGKPILVHDGQRTPEEVYYS